MPTAGHTQPPSHFTTREADPSRGRVPQQLETAVHITSEAAEAASPPSPAREVCSLRQLSYDG